MLDSSVNALERARLLAGIELVEGKHNSRNHSQIVDYLKYNTGSIGKKVFQLCFFAGLDSQQITKIAIKILLFFVLIVLLAVFFANAYLLILILPISLFVYLLLKRKALIRVRNFDSDYPALLIALASSVRSGLDPLVALMNCEYIFSLQSEIRKAVACFRLDIENAFTEEKAIKRFASSINHPDLQLFRVAFLLARREGSSLGECLHRLAKVTRQRQSFRRKVRAAIAMQKLSAFGIAGCTIVIGIIQYTSNPKALNEALNNPAGFKILLFGVALIIVGLIWMLKIARSRV